MVHLKHTGPYVPTFKLTDGNRNHNAYTVRTVHRILRQHDRPHVNIPKPTHKMDLINIWKQQDNAIIASGDWRADDYVSDGFDALPVERRVLFKIAAAATDSENAGDADDEAVDGVGDSASELIGAQSHAGSTSEDTIPSKTRGKHSKKLEKSASARYLANMRSNLGKNSRVESEPESLGDQESMSGDEEPPATQTMVQRAPSGAKMKYTIENRAARDARLGADTQGKTPTRGPSQSLFGLSPSLPDRSHSGRLWRGLQSRARRGHLRSLLPGHADLIPRPLMPRIVHIAN